MISGNPPQDNDGVPPIMPCDRVPVVNTEVKRPNMLKRSSFNKLGALFETASTTDCNVTTKDRLGDVAKIARCLGTSA